MSKVAVILFNLGGPDSLKTVQPFLFNLFNDPAIINRSKPIRWVLAKLISAYRAKAARSTYDCIGGCSPLAAETEAQAQALEAALVSPDLEVRVLSAMRYWHPLISNVAQTVKQWHPNQVILLPLYPQFSSVTTVSSLAEWNHATTSFKVKTTAICCWPTQPDWIEAVTDLTRQGIEVILGTGSTYSQSLRILFSAHGLPDYIITRGDPYQHQVEETVAAVVTALQEPNLDYRICYQSRVGLRQWIGPATRDLIIEAGINRVSIVLVPVTFVSEHIETLVELDIEYRHVAEMAGVPIYIRVPTARVHPHFIAGLAKLVRGVLACENERLCSRLVQYHCPLLTLRCVA